MIKTYSEFITRIEATYGPYSDIHKTEVAVYISKRIPESELDRLFWKIREELSAVYKTPPDITLIGKLVRKSNEQLEAEALSWWRRLNLKKDYMRDCVIEDLRVQAAIETMGGWVWFCTRMVQDESGQDIDHWNRKQFLSLYKLYSEVKPEGEVKILYGQGQFKRNEKIVMIGDSNRCAELLLDMNIKKNDVHQLADDLAQKLLITSEV